MLFNILILAAFAAIVFVHYIRGLFSGVISAILAGFSAVFALSYYEPLTERFLAGQFANTAHAMMFLILFSFIYLMLRVVFDKMVPGNVRVPAIVDKVGGAVMGVIAAIFAVGSVAIAGQMLPFSPAPGGYAKYPVTDKRPVTVPAGLGKRNLDASTYDELSVDESATFGDESQRQSLWGLSADQLVVSLTEHLSEKNGALSRRPMKEFHPDLLQELFGQRLGIQTGANRVMMNPDNQQRAISSVNLYQIDKADLEDFEYEKYRPARVTTLMKTMKGVLKPKTNEMLVVARVMLTRNAGDKKDFILRFSPGSVRLVGKWLPLGMEDEEKNYVPKDYHPYGFMDNGKLVAAKMDDFLFVALHEKDKGIDLAFLVERKPMTTEGDAKGGVVARLRPGVFLEINRMGREDLSGKDIVHGLPASDKIEVLRKKTAVNPTQQPVTPTTPTTPTPPPVAVPASTKLIGSWMGMTEGGDSIILEFKAGNQLAFVSKGAPGTGSWKVLSETPNIVNIERTIGDNSQQAVVTVVTDDEISYTPAGGKAMKMTRRK